MNRIANAIVDVSHILDVWLPTRVGLSDISGLSVAIAYKGKILYKKGFGYADVEKKIKAKENTIYHIASISKTFTAVAILQLEEKGLLKLDDKASKYVTWFKGENKNGDLKNITIRQLLSNTSGVWRDGDTPHWTTGKFPKSLKSASKDILVFKPSSEFKYSNYGFSILGEVITAVTGLSYEEYARKNIINSLKLNSTHPDYKDSIQNLASGYGKEERGSTREKFGHYKANAYMPASGFLSSAIDLAKYAYYLSPKADESILKKASKKKMMKPHRKTEGKDKYCLGLEEYKIDKRKINEHGGGFQGFATKMAFDRENEITVAVLANCTHSPVSSIASSIFDAIYSLIDGESKYKSKKKIKYDMYEGVYRNLWGNDVVVRAGKALVQFSLYSHAPLRGDNKQFLEPTGEDQFVVKGGSVFHSRGEIVRFSNLKNGKFQLRSIGPTPSKRIV